MNVKNIKIGESYYGISGGWGSRVKYGVAISFEQDTHVRMQGIYPITSGNFGSKIDELFETKEEAYAYLQHKDDKQVEEYVNSIQNIEDLLQFPLKHNVSKCDEYANYNARRAYIEVMNSYNYPIDIEPYE